MSSHPYPRSQRDATLGAADSSSQPLAHTRRVLIRKGMGVKTSRLIAEAGIPFEYVYPTGNQLFTLSANQLLINVIVNVFTQADFYWRGLTYVSTGPFSIRFQDGEQYYLASGLVPNVNLPKSPGDPFPWAPQIPYPAGGKILFDIQDTSGAPNTIQLVFIGENQYRVQSIAA